MAATHSKSHGTRKSAKKIEISPQNLKACFMFCPFLAIFAKFNANEENLWIFV